MAVIIWFLLSRTTYGKKLYMIGTNEKVARFSGLKVDRVLIKTYALSGICAALGGMIMLANYIPWRARITAAGYTLQCILIAVLGGVSPNGRPRQALRRHAGHRAAVAAGGRHQPLPADLAATISR